MLDEHYQAEELIVLSYSENSVCLTEVCHRGQETPADTTCDPHGDDTSRLPAKRPN